jgi:hypothetical protein
VNFKKIAAIVCAVLLSGCADSRSVKNTSDTAAGTSNVLADDASGIPQGADAPNEYPLGGEWVELTTWGNDVEFNTNVYDTWQEGMRVCMASRGFTYVPYDGPVFNDLRYINPLNEPASKKWGYHPPKDLSVERIDAYNLGKGEAFDLAMSDPKTGCKEIAGKYSSEGITREYSELAMKTGPGAVLSGWDVSSEGVVTLQAWSGCMRESGYSFGSPSDAALKYDELPEVSAEELQVRAVDLVCNRKVELTKKESMYQKVRFEKWQEENAEAIKDLEKLRVVAQKEIIVRRERLVKEGVKALGIS